MMMEPEHLPGLIPSQYTNSKLWRFLLDTRADAPRPDEPRFKQFSENLRNYAVAAVMFKGAQFMVVSLHHPLLTIGRYLLISLATATTVFCLLQQFGLIVISYHWYIGWDAVDDVVLTRDRKHRQNLKKLGIDDGKHRASLKFLGFFLIPPLFLWAMLAFVLSPVR